MAEGDDKFVQASAYSATFIFEVDKKEIGRFTEVNGLEVEVGVDPLEEGGQNGFVHKLPGRMTWPDIVLKRGLTQSDNLFEWLNKCSGEGFDGQGNKLERSTAAITLMSADGNRLRSWEFEGAFPVKWVGPSFAATSTEFATETLTIAHHGFKAKNL